MLSENYLFFQDNADNIETELMNITKPEFSAGLLSLRKTRMAINDFFSFNLIVNQPDYCFYKCLLQCSSGLNLLSPLLPVSSQTLLHLKASHQLDFFLLSSIPWLHGCIVVRTLLQNVCVLSWMRVFVLNFCRRVILLFPCRCRVHLF